MTADDAIAAAKAGHLLTAAELAAIFQLGATRFGELRRAGAFDAFKVHPAIGLRVYSGTLVARYLDGQPLYEPSFGHKRMAR